PRPLALPVRPERVVDVPKSVTLVGTISMTFADWALRSFWADEKWRPPFGNTGTAEPGNAGSASPPARDQSSTDVPWGTLRCPVATNGFASESDGVNKSSDA